MAVSQLYNLRIFTLLSEETDNALKPVYILSVHACSVLGIKPMILELLVPSSTV